MTEEKKRQVDLAVETNLYNEESLIIIFHEPRAAYVGDFNQRMFIYFSRLFEKHKKHILPIVIFSHSEKKNEPTTFKINLPFIDILQFNYLTIELKKKNWRDDIRQDNPVAAAFLSMMRYDEHDRVEVKKEFLRMMARLDLDLDRTEILTGFFETHLKLNDHEEGQLHSELEKFDPEEVRVMAYISSYQEKGRAKGKLEGKKGLICTYIRTKFEDET